MLSSGHHIKAITGDYSKHTDESGHENATDVINERVDDIKMSECLNDRFPRFHSSLMTLWVLRALNACG